MIIEEIKSNLHPGPYTNIEDEILDSIFHASLTIIGRVKYCVLVSQVQDIRDIQRHLVELKSALKSYYKANFLRGVGLLWIIIGDRSKWLSMLDEIHPDLHGLQTVILQGVVFIDEEKQVHQFARSKWGPVKFGNLHGQMDRIVKILENFESQPPAI
jgi:hypothetical protein